VIKLGDQFREQILQSRGEVRLGKPLPWTIFDNAGRLLMRKGLIVETPAQLMLLAEQAAYRTGDAANPVHTLEERRKAPFFVLGEMMGRLNAALTAIATQQQDSPIERLNQLSTGIQVMCAEDADAALAAIHLDREGKYTVRHLIHSALLVELVAYRLGYAPDDRHRMICASLTANVGMLDLQEGLLKQGAITPEQRREINRHPERSVALLRQAGVDDESWLEFVLQHHERMDGSGYPAGLHGDTIHVAARLIALADIYHAKISDRIYRAAMLPTHALRQVFLGHGKDVDQDLAKVFIKELGVFPPGGFVKLANGELAVVTHRAQDGTAPRVASIITPRGAPYPRPLPRDTSKSDCAIRETAVRDESILLTDLLPLWGY
jgi:HD-GYP domain-containing protein (c-di-GMP phosphodiesterase class II)